LKTVASIPIGAGPAFAAIQPLGNVRGPEIFSIHPTQRKAYVPNMDTHDVSVVNLETNKVAKVILVGQKPHHSTISPDGRLVYVLNSGGAKTVSAIDTTTDEVVATIFVGEGATGILFKPDASLAYVVNRASNTVSVIDTHTHQVVQTIKTGVHPETGAMTADGTRLYVTNSGSHDVTVIDAISNQVLTTITNVGRGPWAVAVAGGSGFCH
jgi:YVTN family beta-propeller protein